MLTAIGDVMRRCYDKGWITTRDGNISLRKRDGTYLYITPSGMRKTIVHPEWMVKIPVAIENGVARLMVKEGQNPSGELDMHWNLQRNNPRVRVVVHVHATHIVAAMYRGFDLQQIAREFAEVKRYTRVGPSVPALPALTREFADATAACIGIMSDGTLEYDIVGQSNHGVCAVGPDPWSAYEHVERLNHICEIVLNSGVCPEVKKIAAVER
jgi:L-fuculose-phosphate aldolase